MLRIIRVPKQPQPKKKDTKGAKRTSAFPGCRLEERASEARYATRFRRIIAAICFPLMVRGKRSKMPEKTQTLHLGQPQRENLQNRSLCNLLARELRSTTNQISHEPAKRSEKQAIWVSNRQLARSTKPNLPCLRQHHDNSCFPSDGVALDLGLGKKTGCNSSAKTSAHEPRARPPEFRIEERVPEKPITQAIFGGPLQRSACPSRSGKRAKNEQT